MKRILLAFVAILAFGTSTYAQVWDQVNGSMQVKSGPSAPLVIVDQTAAGQKIQSWRNNGTEKCYIDVSGNLNCAGTFTLTGQFLAGDGSASAPSYSFTSRSTFGLWQPVADRLMLSDGTTATRFDVTNTLTSLISHEAFSVDWQTTANNAIAGVRTAATGTRRPLAVVTQESSAGDFFGLLMNRSALPFLRVGTFNTSLNFTGANAISASGNFITLAEYTNAVTSGSVGAVAILPTYNQSSGTAANTDLLVNRTPTAVGSGAQLLADFQNNSVSKWSISNTGLETTTQTTPEATVQQLITTATNDDPTEKVFQGRVATTDATPTTINTITIPTSTSTLIECRVVNRRTGGSSGSAEDSAGYYVWVVVKNTAGTVAEIAAETTTTVGESIAGYNVTAAPSGATELIQVTGAATTNITWHSTCRSYGVNQ